MRLVLAACLALGCGKQAAQPPAEGPPAKIAVFDLTDQSGKDLIVLGVLDANDTPVSFRGTAEVVLMQGAVERCRSTFEVAHQGPLQSGRLAAEVEVKLDCKPPAGDQPSVAKVVLTLADGRKLEGEDGYPELYADRLAKHIATTPDAGAPPFTVDRTPVTDHDEAQRIIDRYLASVDAILAAVDGASEGLRACPQEVRSAIKDPLSPKVAQAERAALAALKGGPAADPAFAWMSATEHQLRKRLDGDASIDVLEVASYLEQRPPYLLIAAARERRMPVLVREEEHGTGAFEGGLFDGKLVLVEAATGAYLCSGPLRATSSERVEYEPGDRTELDADFLRRFAEAAATARGDMAAPAAGDPGGLAVVLRSAGANRIQVIKVVRDATQLGLRESKDLVEGAPRTVKSGLTRADAEALARQLTEAGAEVAIE